MDALDHAITTLDGLCTTLQCVPFIGHSLKAAVELAKKICEAVQHMKNNRKSYEELAVRVARLLAAIADVLQKAKLEKLNGMEGNVSHLLQVLQEIHSTIHKRLRLGPANPSAGKFSRIKNLFRDKGKDLHNVSEDEREIQKYRQKIDEAIQEFDVASQMRGELSLEDVRALSMSISKHVEEMQRDQSKDATNAVLASLKPVSSARWDEARVPPCMADTRKQLLADIAAWAASPTAPLVFWLNGLAGTGKSTVARTMCEQLDEQGLLAASFFITRQVSERRAAPNIIRTLAYQLARHQQPVATALCGILRDTPELAAAESLSKLVSELFNKSAEAVSPGAGLILVIDALDECTEDAQGRPGGDLATLLVRGLLQLSGRLKLLITSRAEPTIQRIFEDLSADAQQAVLQLHDLDRAMVRSDIKIYLTRSCEAIVKTRRELSLTDWPSPADIENLADMSDVLFVFASTAIRFLDSPKQSPRARLDFMLARREGKLGSPFRFLDQLYMQVLENAVRTGDDDEDMLCDRLRSIMGGIVVVQYPLPVEAYATLLHMEHDDVQLAAESLSAFLLLKQGESVRIFHPSFPDFITNPKRCDDARFRVTVADHHRELAYGCLVLLNQHLCYDIANLGDPSIANVDIADLDGKLDSAVRSRLAARTPGITHDSRLDHALPGVLRYACRYWTSHLASTVEADVTLRNELISFCHQNLFHWVELLSLIGAFPNADQTLRVTIAWCETHMSDVQTSSTGDLLRDTLRVMQIYSTPIRTHALHVYHSAFVTMPKCSLHSQLSQQYGQAALPQMLSLRDTSWAGRWVTVLEGHEDWVLSLSVSADGRRVASGARDKTVRVWDTITFEELAVFKGHDDWVTSVVFCHDGQRLVSASVQGTIHVWDAISYSAKPIAVLVDDPMVKVLSVAVTPDGQCIASASEDFAVRIWDAVSYDLRPRKLQGHDDKVKMIAYSHNGQRLVSCSEDGTVRMWDVDKGEQLGVMKHDRPVLSVALSWDGTRIASGSSDQTARIWDASTYNELARLEGHEYQARTVVFSPDGKWVVSGSGNGVVRVWDTQAFSSAETITVTSNMRTELVGHEGDVNCIAFLPDGRSFISASNDGTMRVWDTFDSVSLVTRDRPEVLHRWVSTVKFSDGGHADSGRGNTLVRIFSEAVESSKIPTPEGHTEEVRSVIYSPDHPRIVADSVDGAVLLWLAMKFGPSLADFEHDTGTISALATSPDGTRFASAAQCGLQLRLRVWDALHSSKKPATLAPDYKMHALTMVDCLVMSLTFTADGDTLVLRTVSGELYAWKRNEKRQDVADEVWTEVPIALEDVPVPPHDGPIFSGTYSGWVECTLGTRKFPVLWLPIERRAKDSAVHDTIATEVVIASRSGGTTVIDFSRVLGKLSALE